MDNLTSTNPHQHPPFIKGSYQELTLRAAARLLSPAELIPDVSAMATVQLFVASVLKQITIAHFIAMAKLVVRNAYVLDHPLHDQVFQSQMKPMISTAGTKIQTITPSIPYTMRCLRGYSSVG